MMLLSVASGLGLHKKIQEKISAFNGHIIISHFDENESQGNTTPLDINQSFYTNADQIEYIEHIQATATKAGIIRTEETFEGILLKGVGKDYKWDYISEYLTQGRTPNTISDLNNELILSEYLVNRLDLRIGDTFSTYFMKKTGSKRRRLPRRYGRQSLRGVRRHGRTRGRRSGQRHRGAGYQRGHRAK